MLFEIVCPSLADTFDEKDGETPQRSSFPMDCGELSRLPGATGEHGRVPDKNKIIFHGLLKLKVGYIINRIRAFIKKMTD